MKILLMFTFIFVLFATANGQETDNFRYVMSVKKDAFCIGESTEIVGELTNISNAPMVIDVRKVSSGMTFRSVLGQGQFEFFYLGRGGGSSHYVPDFIILQPNETYKKILKFSFVSIFFKYIPHKYQMNFEYWQSSKTKFENIEVWEGSVQSNKIEVFVTKCD